MAEKTEDQRQEQSAPEQSRATQPASGPAAPKTAAERQQGRLAERKQKARARRVVRLRARAKALSSKGTLEATPPRERQPGKQKVRRGVVVSNRAEKTISVRIDSARRHRSYAKIVRTSTTLHAHDERSDANIGDTVVVRECRPLSRTKRWRLVEVIERAK